MPQNDRQSSTPEEKHQYVKDFSFRILRKINLRVATLFTFVGSMFLGTVAFMDRYAVSPVEKELSSTQNELSNTKELAEETERKRIKLEVDTDRRRIKLESANKELVGEIDELNQLTKVPTLIFPVDNRAIIGQYVRFKWSYGVKSGFKNFVLELRRVGARGSVVSRYPIPEGHKRREILFQFPEAITGQFYWRIGTGELLHEHRPHYTSLGSNQQVQKTHPTDKKSESESEDGEIENNLKETAANKQGGSGEETRLWSRFGSFSMYKSVWEKLKQTQNLVVGTTAAFLSYDYPVDCGGRPDNYDMDLIDEIAKNLAKKLKAEVEVESDVRFWLRARNKSVDHVEEENKNYKRWKTRFLDSFRLNVVTKIIDWDDKFNSVIGGNVDLTIANLTSSRTREEENTGLIFTNGYRENKQIIIASKIYPPIKTSKLKGSELIAELKGKLMAVQETSTNMDAAQYLQKQFGYEIDTWPYDSYVDVIDRVRSGKTQFGMIDNLRFRSVSYPDLMALDIDLDGHLKKFNIDTFGSEKEQYAIAVANHGGRNLFLNYLNQAIDDSEQRRNELHDEHDFSKERRVPHEASFGCERRHTAPWILGFD